MIVELLNINLMKEMGLDALPNEKRSLLIDQMLEVLESRINLEALSLLTEAEKKELDKVLDSDGDLIEFLRSKIPNFDLMVAETVANYKKEIFDMQTMATATK